MGKLVQTTAPGFVKDESTGFVHNQNMGELEVLKSRRRQAVQLSDMEKRITELERKVRELEGRLRDGN